ncbi:MAG: UTP--glucose-1-phosphate uridylyltransferase GalU [Acidimicrobiia bacterium]|nr:UTP--glucose-1-phosphate uridylyltransferase GalU [Acidimicrobiia bacterium]
MSTRVRKAVIPAAGLGTRFLPATKAQPKEMLTIVDKPAIQYVVEEAIEAGIDDILIVTGTAKKSLEDHFDRNFELETLLERKNKHAELQQIIDIAEMATFHFTRQGQPLGLGHAVLMAEQHVGDEPFVVLLPDELMTSRGGTVKAMVEAFEEYGCSNVALREVPMEDVSSYGCAATEDVAEGIVRIPHIVEKPAVADAPSNRVVMGRYLFTPDIFEHLHNTKPGVGNEIQLTDAMAQVASGSGLFGVIDNRGSWDAGQKLDFLRAQVELGLEHPELGEDFRVLLEKIVNR